MTAIAHEGGKPSLRKLTEKTSVTTSDRREPIQLHVSTCKSLTLTAYSEADVKLLDQLRSILGAADASVRLTTLLELWARHQNRKAA